MTFSSLATRTSPTPNQDQGRGGSAVTTVVLHHMATTNFEGVLSMWASASRQGSANYAISNRGEVVGVVPEENRSWSLSDYAFDAKSITFEIANEAVGGSWPVSAAAHEATAQVVADVCRRYGIVCNRVNVLGHREVYERYGVSYPTACPGGLNMDAIVARANQIVSEDPFVIKQEEDMHYYRATQPSADGKIAAGYIYVQDATGPLRALDNLQGSYVIELEKQNRVFIAEWLGDDIRGLIERVGIREYLPMPPGAAMATGTPLVGPGKLTERILYSNDTLPDYPLATIG